MELWKLNEILAALKENNNIFQSAKSHFFCQVNELSISSNLVINKIAIDSRNIGNNCLFIAFKGEVNDGHNFIAQSFENGASLVIAERIPEDLNQNLIPRVILVNNSILALKELAKYARSRSRAKIIAITGSVGKTSTKEMLKIVFDSQGKTYATAGNLNNHFGLPLSMANMPSDCDFAIFEIGMNHHYEIEPLVKMLKPHLAAITTIAPVHIEFFKDESDIALAKSEIFYGFDGRGGIAVLNHDSPHFEFLLNQARQRGVEENNIFSFGKTENKRLKKNYQILRCDFIESSLSKVQVKLPNQDKIEYKVGSINLGHIINSLVALCSLDAFGCELASGLNSLEKYHQTSGRGQVIKISFDSKNLLVIDDSYNASIASIKSGIEYAKNLFSIDSKNGDKNRLIFAIGDMLELGKNSLELHREAITEAINKNPDLLILVGAEMKKALDSLLPEFEEKNKKLRGVRLFLNSEIAASEIKKIVSNGDLIYVKGSRGIKMERIINQLNIK